MALTTEQLDALLSVVGAHMDSDADWARVAMACVDQAMVSLRDQKRIETILHNAIGDGLDPYEGGR